MLGHRRPPRALTSAREPHRRTALGAPAGPHGQKLHWERHLAALATKDGEKCRLDEQWIDGILVEINTVAVEIGKAQSVGAVDSE